MHKTAVTSTITVLNIKSYTSFWQLSLIYWQYLRSAYFIARAATKLYFKAFSPHRICLLECGVIGEDSLCKLGLIVPGIFFTRNLIKFKAHRLAEVKHRTKKYTDLSLTRTMSRCPTFPCWIDTQRRRIFSLYTSALEVLEGKQCMGFSCYPPTETAKPSRLT